MTTAPAAQVEMTAPSFAYVEFSRGETHVMGEGNEFEASLEVEFDGRRRASTRGTKLDEAGLRMLVREAESAARQNRSPAEAEPFLPPQRYPTPTRTYFESVATAMLPERRAELVERATTVGEKASLIVAGNLRCMRDAYAVMNSNGLFAYQRSSYGELSVTMRTEDGTGSGWAWSGSEDWARVDVTAVIDRAVDLARRSANPVAVEPGRYTVIMEPAATASFIEWILMSLSARGADGGYSVFSKDPRGTNKIGLRMMDDRLSLVSDPWDPDLPRGVIGPNANPLKRVPWFVHGVLRNLEYDYLYARERHREPVYNPVAGRLSFDGPAETLEDMIRSTRRGIWVNRFSGVSPMNQTDGRTLLLSGTTRDGTFLIENGKITKPIKNFRFTESPFFVFNKLEAAGEPVRASFNVVAPRLKVQDFNFTSLTDAI